MDGFKLYCDYVDSIAKTLTHAGHNIVHFKHVNVIKLEYEGATYYVDTYPAFVPYNENITFHKITCSAAHNSITLGFSRGSVNLKLTSNIVTIYNESTLSPKRGISYKQSNNISRSFMGRLSGKEFIDYKNKWITGEFHINSSILNLTDFTPAKCQTLDIINDGIKILLSSEEMPVGDTCTMFLGNFIINGSYKVINHNNIFNCVNEDGELFAQIYDPTGQSLILANASRAIDLIHKRTIEVMRKNNLYDGYELKNKSGEVVTGPFIYRFNDIFFDFSSGIQIYEAHKPNGGKFTKPPADVSSV